MRVASWWGARFQWPSLNELKAVATAKPREVHDRPGPSVIGLFRSGALSECRCCPRAGARFQIVRCLIGWWARRFLDFIDWHLQASRFRVSGSVQALALSKSSVNNSYVLCQSITSTSTTDRHAAQAQIKKVGRDHAANRSRAIPRMTISNLATRAAKQSFLCLETLCRPNRVTGRVWGYI